MRTRLVLDNNGIEECAAVCKGVSCPGPWRAGNGRNCL